MVRLGQNFSVIPSSSDLDTRNSILCIVKDLTDVNTSCKIQSFNLSNTFTVSQFITEVADRYSYEESTFTLMWKCGNDSISMNTEYYSHTLSEIGLQDSNVKNTFELHEKDGPPIRKIKESDQLIGDEMPKIEDIITSDQQSSDSTYPSYQQTPPYPSYFRTSNYYNDSSDGQVTNLLSGGGEDNYETGFVGLINQAMTCYLNSLLQTLYMTPEFRNAIYRWQYKPALQSSPLSIEQINASKKNIPYQLQKLFLQMQTTNKKCLHTQDLTQSFGWGSDDAFQQHDVQELCRVMFDALEKMFKGTEQENLITELYEGKLKDYVKCVECNTESARVDVYLDIQLSIKSYIDEYNYNLYDSIEKALSAYIEPEILEGNNKYYCEKCKKLCKAHKGIIFEQFPYILCLQLKRFDFDYKTMMRIKLNNKVTFPDRLDIKPYLDESVLIQKPDLKTDYELFSIMIHSGSATGGHYYAYVKDFLTDQWYNFNDERVTRLDPNDIQKAYGVSYSSFSSTTAYMLLYRQIDVKRNELFLIKDEYPSHIYDLLKREQDELEEAEKLKEYLENLCKIKIIIVNTSQMDNFKPNELQFAEKQCSLHKDLTIEQAKHEIAKEFSLSRPDDEFIKNRTRLVKYDMYNEHIEQSFDNELTTIFEALNHMKQIYGYCWIFEVNGEENEKFSVYKSGSISIRFTEINPDLYKTVDLFNIRVDNDTTPMELLIAVNSRIRIVDDNDEIYYDKIIDRIHLAFERQNTFNPYIYLNDHLNKSLSSLGFLKSNKIFIEYKKVEDDEMVFNKNKFFYTLQTITNLISLTCYLPTQESAQVYKNKLSRRCAIIDKKAAAVASNRYENENLAPSYEEVMIARGSSINVVHTAAAKTIITSDSNENNKELVFNDEMSIASSSNSVGGGGGFNKRRNAFIDNNNLTAYEEDEDELDFGNLTNKVFKQKQNDDNNSSNGGMLKRRFSDELSKSVDNIQLKTTKRSDIEDDMSVSSPSQPPVNTQQSLMSTEVSSSSSPSSSSTLNLKDISIDVTNPQQKQPFYHHQQQHIIDMETSLDEGIGSGSSPNNIKNSPNSLDNLHGSPDANLNEIDDLDSAAAIAVNSSNENKFSMYDDVGCSNVNDNNEDDIDAVDNLSTNNDHYGPYSQNSNNNNNNNEDWDRDAEIDNLNKKFNFNSNNNNPSSLINDNIEYEDSEQETFINSNLITNSELGTRTLEITMDKRITIIDFKRYIKNYININTEDFRVFRMGPNDFESELTRNENQFQYIPQNSKFLIKLGPVLKYGEYLVPVHKIIRNTGFTYLCEFMIEHNFSVLDHKILLREDLKEECNEDIPLDRMRLRRKTLKQPAQILLDDMIFGRDAFINTSSELCVEILNGPEIKTDKSRISIYLRKWNPNDYVLDLIEEILIDGPYNDLLKAVSEHSKINLENLEVLRCKREYPFKIPILEIHKDSLWRENYSQSIEKIEEGACFYYRDKRELLGVLTEDKRRELTKDSLKSNTTNPSFTSSSSSSSTYFKKETGVKIHI